MDTTTARWTTRDTWDIFTKGKDVALIKKSSSIRNLKVLPKLSDETRQSSTIFFSYKLP
jgi:hypothetical protein